MSDFATIGVDGGDLFRARIATSLSRRWSSSANFLRVWPRMACSESLSPCGGWSRLYLMLYLDNTLKPGDRTHSFLLPAHIHMTVLMIDCKADKANDVLAVLNGLCECFNTTFMNVQFPPYVRLERWTRKSWNYVVDEVFLACFQSVRAVCAGAVQPLRFGCTIVQRDPHVTWC